jgi:hypothetical protein
VPEYPAMNHSVGRKPAAELWSWKNSKARPSNPRDDEDRGRSSEEPLHGLENQVKLSSPHRDKLYAHTSPRQRAPDNRLYLNLTLRH